MTIMENMPQTVSGGKVWSIPAGDEIKVTKKNKVRAYLLTIGACATVALGMLLSTKFFHGSAHIDEASSVPGAIPRTIEISPDGWLIPILLATTVISVCMAFDLLNKKTAVYTSKGILAFRALFGIMLFLYAGFTAHTFMYPGGDAVMRVEHEWIKEHYQVEVKDRSYFLSREVKGTREDGSEVVLKTFRSDRGVYLYENEDELKAIINSTPNLK